MSAAGSMRSPELRRAVVWMVVAGAMWTGVEALGAMLSRAVSPVLGAAVFAMDREGQS